MECLEVEQAAKLLLEQDWILILCHKNPDGDTIGSGFALCRALHQLGKHAAVLCGDNVPRRMAFAAADLDETLRISPKQARYVVSVDIANTSLMGLVLSDYQQEGAVDLAIDHHPSHSGFASNLLLRPEEAANCQIIYELLLAMGVEITPEIASCLYLGLSTDTGCFRFSNTQPRTHQLAARLMEAGADWFEINRNMFEIKTRSQIALEQKALRTLRFFCGGRAAALVVTRQMLQETGASMEETEAIVNVPKSIERVEIGATLKEQPEGGFKVSVRTGEGVDACEICSAFGGGGHKRAAGCQIMQTLDETMLRLCKKFEEVLS